MTQPRDGSPHDSTEPQRLTTDTATGAAADADTDAPVVPLLELSALPTVIESPAALDDAVEAFAAGTGPIAIDAERASGFRYSSRAYLVQLRRAGAGTALIDPIPFGDVPNESLRPLGEAVVGASWVLHAASQDLACLAELGMRPRELFDTELAGRLLNYPRVGLAVLVEELLGFRLRKEHSAVDWSRRPLPDSWLRYAALDVEVLVELRNVLADQLESQGKAEWARQEFAALAATTFGLPRVDPWRRTSGIHRIRGRRGLAVVKALWEARDALARQRDTIGSRILPDAALVAAALADPQSRSGLSRVPGFDTRNAQRYLRQFVAAIAAARALDDADLPRLAPPSDGPPPARAWVAKHPAAADRLASCRRTVREVAATVDVPQENVLPPDAVRRLAWQPPQPVSPQSVAAALKSAGARPWQVDLTAPALAAALEANSAEPSEDPAV
jgi:ribonuclease D